MAEEKITNEKLAAMISRGFEAAKGDLFALETRTNARFDTLENRLTRIENKKSISEFI